MTPIRLTGIQKSFGKTVAVDGIDLSIKGGDLFFLLGPSGCGKTTLLRMVAGFNEPDQGTIYFGDQNVTHQLTNQRDTGMVFQGYALWPHMTVAENVAFGLTVGVRKKKFDAAARTEKVKTALETVQMSPYAERKINQLSGGQQQRVALARALVVEPSVLLLDEPLSNLDAKLRLEMRSEIRRICKQARITGVYVTHDQKEALSMADGIAVLNQGKVVQQGSPQALYSRPNTRFVADFLGETNFVTGVVLEQKNGQAVLDTPLGNLTTTAIPEDLPSGGNVTCSIRPEALHIVRSDVSAGSEQAANVVTARVQQTIYLGELAQHALTVGEYGPVKCFELNPRPVAPSQALRLQVAPEDVVVLSD